jgi:hypothetical protein
MITNIGKNLMSKYLIGQAPSYASYIAIGCGKKPLGVNDAFDIADAVSKTKLDFEMFRVPIISRGYINDNGSSKIIFTGELPTTERYEITEVGVFSAKNNPIAGSLDSRILYSFSRSENWQHHTSSSVSAVPVKIEPLDSEDSPNVILATEKAFQTNANNLTLLSEDRIVRYESTRFLNNSVFIRGDIGNLSRQPGSPIVIGTGSEHIHLNGMSPNFNRNSPNDELSIAFSIANKTGGVNVLNPDRVLLMVEFASSDIINSQESERKFARLEVDIENGTTAGKQDFTTNRYVVATKRLKDLVTSQNFDWASVQIVTITASVIVNGEPSSDFYVCLDGVRFENVTSISPVYGLSGYSVVKTEDSLPIIKSANTSNLVEFRFAVDLDLEA